MLESVPESGGGGVPESGVVVTPPSGWIVPPQMPCDVPVGMTHGRPVQQSAFVVHAPFRFTQAAWHFPPTHGVRLQQSALVAQVPPGFAQVRLTRQRGMPSESGLQHWSDVATELQRPGDAPIGSQQLFSSEHA